MDPLLDYPLGERRPELVTTPARTPLAEVTLEGLRAGRVSPDELRATPRDAAAAGRRGACGGPGSSLPRTSSGPPSSRRLPDDEVLSVYTALRPRRATAAELEVIAQHLADVARTALRRVRARGGVVMAERGLLRSADVSEEPRSERFRVRADRAAAARDADPPRAGARPRRDERPGRSRALARDQRRRRQRARRQAARALRHARPLHRRARHRPRGRTRGDGARGRRARAPARRRRRAACRARAARARTHAGQARARRRPARPGRDDVRAQAPARPACARQPGARHEPQGEPRAARRRRGRGRAARLRGARDDRGRVALRAAQRDGAPGRLADRALRA